MDELSNKDKEEAEDSEERKTLSITLMKIHFQKNIIRYTLSNIMSIDEKNNEAQKYDVNIDKSGKWEFSQSVTLRYLLISHHCLPLFHMADKMLINNLSISSWVYVKS